MTKFSFLVLCVISGFALSSGLAARDTTRPCGHKLDCTDRPDGWYTHPWNCRKYWHCLGGVGIPFLCENKQGQNLLFDPVNVWCNWPDTVDCGERPVCDECDENCNTPPTHPTHPPTQTPGQCHHECTQNGDFAEECCGTNFCKCWNGVGTLFPCPPGQFFNEAMDMCDWPDRIPCCN